MNFSLDSVTNKIEEKTGMDVNRDGHIGGGGMMGQAEKATHCDINHDGHIGGRPHAGGAGK